MYKTAGAWPSLFGYLLAVKMDAVVRRKVSFPSLPKSLRRVLVFGVPAIALLGILGLAGWRLLRGSRRRRANNSPAPETKCVEGQGSPAGSEDSGVVDAGSQEGGSRKTSQENLHSVQRLTSRLTYHPGIKEFVPQHQLQHEPASQNIGMPQQDVEAPLKEEEHGANSKGWPYPTASSDLQSETFSELDSLSSSEGLLSMPPRSPIHVESSTVPSPATSGHMFPSSKHKGDTQFSTSASCLECPSVNAQPVGIAASRSTPTVSKQDRVRVILQLPKDLVGRFIGKQGRNIKALMADSDGAHVYVNQKNLAKDALIVPCTVQGTAQQVEQALQIIQSKYPEVDVPSRAGDSEASGHPPNQSPLFSTPQEDRESWDTDLRPAVVPGSPFKAMVSYIESLDRVWLVDYEKSSQLDDQHQSMSYTYCYAVVMKKEDKEEDNALLGKFCAVRVSDIHWLRGKITRFSDDGVNFEVQLMDYGSTVVVPSTAIRPLRCALCVCIVCVCMCVCVCVCAFMCVCVCV